MTELRMRFRRIVRRPGYLTAIVLSLATGTAVSLSAFSIASALVFKPHPGIEDRRTIVRMEWVHRAPLFSMEDLDLLVHRGVSSLSPIAAQGTLPLPVQLPSGAKSLNVGFTSGSLFPLLQTRPVIGRLLSQDDFASTAPVAVISERLWRVSYAASPSAIGQPLAIGHHAFTIVGVAPAEFAGLEKIDIGNDATNFVDLFVPLSSGAWWSSQIRPSRPWLNVAGRIRPDMKLAQVRAELEVATRQPGFLRAARPGQPPPVLRVYRGGLDVREEPGYSLLVLGLYLSLPLIVLAIGCVNVINLQLARAIDESAEQSLRLALGASQGRLIGAVSLEMLLLASLGTALGCVGAHFILLQTRAHFPADIGIDRTVLAFGALLIPFVVLVTGLVPAWRNTRQVAAAGLRELHQAGRSRIRLRSALIVVQVATSVSMLAIGGLAIRALTAGAPSIGANAARLVTADIDLAQIPPTVTPKAFVDQLLEKLGTAAGVRGVAATTFLTQGPPVPCRRLTDREGAARVVSGGSVTSTWFSVTGTTFLAGGLVNGQFTSGEVILNRALASALGYSLADAVGARIIVGRSETAVVGIVEDTERSSDGAPLPMVYRPLNATLRPKITVLVLSDDAAATRTAIPPAVAAVDPTVPVDNIATLDARLREVSNAPRTVAATANLLGILSLILAGAGLHSLMSYSVKRRTREFGIRMAIGADTASIAWSVMLPTAWLITLGGAAGMLVAVPVAALIRSTLFGISPLDPAGLLPSVLILMIVAAVAGAGPVYGAVRVDPNTALRQE
ncbi:MAG: ABC transporter permease [Vicinamibacterales bacterium]